ncbi:MAG TPA: trehalase-like domain-containing protein [Candidatus Udaeobacter sp.]|jgi:hypothetical protein
MPAQVSKIQDYAIIGNGRSAALFSNRGSLDWLCWPRFDSASIFGAILDAKVGGYWSIRPAGDSRVGRQYFDNTNVLETTFSTGSGKMVLTDFMPVTSEQEKKRRLWPEHEIIRQIHCQEGEIPVVVDFNPRPDYGRTTALIKNAGKLGWRIQVGTSLLNLRSDIELEPNNSRGLSGKMTLKGGDTVAFSLTFSEEGPAVLPALGDLVGEKLKLTIDLNQLQSAMHSPLCKNSAITPACRAPRSSFPMLTSERNGYETKGCECLPSTVTFTARRLSICSSVNPLISSRSTTLPSWKKSSRVFRSGL